MAKEEESNEKNWKYDGDEAEWDSFDRRMLRHMRKKLDDVDEQMWLGEIGSVFASRHLLEISRTYMIG